MANASAMCLSNSHDIMTIVYVEEEHRITAAASVVLKGRACDGRVVLKGRACESC